MSGSKQAQIEREIATLVADWNAEEASASSMLPTRLMEAPRIRSALSGRVLTYADPHKEIWDALEFLQGEVAKVVNFVQELDQDIIELRERS